MSLADVTPENQKIKRVPNPRSKAAEGRRSPKRWRGILCRFRFARSVLECASPLALSFSTAVNTAKYRELI
jgi:hypothetical protein